jgi:hypothetical protein
MTSSGKKEAGGLNTMKGNSTEVLYKWRNTANMKFVLDVDRQCFSVYENRDISKNSRAKISCVF